MVNSLFTYTEHHNKSKGEPISDGIPIDLPFTIKFRGNEQALCVEVKPDRKLYTIYFVGVDWLIEKETAIYVEPKLNKKEEQTNYLKMLFSALKHPEVVQHTKELFEIKFDEDNIEISQQQDLLTPLLIVQFLRVVKEIVRKGLKKSYYRVEQNLNSKIKGKVLVGRTIKENILKNKMLKTYCSYDEFGYNGFENRLIKKTLLFVNRYLPKLEAFKAKEFTTCMFNYINPAFEFVSDEVSLNDVKHTKKNIFYKEYEEAIRLAKLILQRFGYNITNTEIQTIKTPPFWIDMSKLFELYVLGLLKDRFGKDVKYHFRNSGNELDFLLNTHEYKMVIDAKYKIIYQEDNSKENVQSDVNNSKRKWDIDNIRQLSGYARLQRVYDELKKQESETIDCLIIYPDQDTGNANLLEVDLKKNSIEKFVKFYKVAVELPKIDLQKCS